VEKIGQILSNKLQAACMRTNGKPFLSIDLRAENNSSAINEQRGTTCRATAESRY